MSWKFTRTGILLIIIACLLMTISPLYLIFSVLLVGIGLVALFFSFDRARIVLNYD